MGEAPYSRIVAETANRLGMEADEVDKILDTYMAVSREDVLRRREEARKRPVYAAWLARKQEEQGGRPKD